jgi:hypothetical protein
MVGEKLMSSGGLGEVREMYDLLTQIDAILRGINLATDKIERKAPIVKEQLTSFRELERIALRYLVIARRVGLPEDVQVATETLSRLVIMMRMAQMAMTAFERGTTAGLLLSIAGWVMIGFSAYDMMRGGS